MDGNRGKEALTPIPSSSHAMGYAVRNARTEELKKLTPRFLLHTWEKDAPRALRVHMPGLSFAKSCHTDVLSLPVEVLGGDTQFLAHL